MQGEKIWQEQASGRAYVGVESTGDDVEGEAEWCQKALSMVLDASAKKITICTRSKSWWIGEIKERRGQLGIDKRKRCRSAVTAQAKAELLKSIWRAKDRMLEDYLKTLRGAEVWRAAMFANPGAGASLEALTDRDGKQAHTITEIEETLRQESFPQNEHDQ
jgi:hypothetical protein